MKAYAVEKECSNHPSLFTDKYIINPSYFMEGALEAINKPFPQDNTATTYFSRCIYYQNVLHGLTVYGSNGLLPEVEEQIISILYNHYYNDYFVFYEYFKGADFTKDSEEDPRWNELLDDLKNKHRRIFPNGEKNTTLAWKTSSEAAIVHTEGYFS